MAKFTTLAIGEEEPKGPKPTTEMYGEEDPIVTTQALGEEDTFTTQAIGEEDPILTTQAIGEEDDGTAASSETFGAF